MITLFTNPGFVHINLSAIIFGYENNLLIVSLFQMNYEQNVSGVRQINQELDFKVTKRHYPRDNNDSILEFIFEKDPNLFMRKNKIVIRGAIELPENVVPDNGFVSKLFSMLTVEVDSQTVSSNRCK